jgi:hypothetical protein
MELTPAERIKLNAAIVNSVKTGQPLSSNLQTLYDRAAQVKSVRQTQPRALLNPGFPTRNVTEVFVDSVTGKRDTYKHSGPASSLPIEDFEELYPRVVPVPRAVPWSQQNKNGIQEELVRTPFQREFDFTNDPGSDWVDQDRVSIQDRSQRFLQNYFGGDPGKVVNPSTGRFYGDELKIHDAMHDFANVGNTLRGEELITIAEQAGASPLQSSNIGLENLTQQFLIGSKYSPAEVTDEAMSDLRGSTRMRGPTLIQQRGAKRGSSLYRDANNIGSFLSPPISKEEYGTMINRGREFYDQVHNNYANFKRFNTVGNEDLPAARKINEAAFFKSTYGPSRAVTQGIVGGYGKSNSIPFGNYMSLMNAPLVPTVNEGLWNESIKKQLTSLAPSVEAAIKTEQDVYNSPEQEAIRKAPGRWEDRFQLLREAGDADKRKMYTGKEQFIEDEDFKGYMQRLKENKPDLAATVNTPEFDRDVRVFNALRESNPGDLKLNIPFRTIRDIAEDTIGPRPQLDYDVLRDQQKLTSSFNSLDWVGLGKTQDALQGGIDDTRNVLKGGITGAGPTKEGRVYLNPANLGANNLSRDLETPLFQRSASSILFSPSGRTPNDILLQAAAEAKQIEGYNKALPGIKQAIRTGANATTDITGAIPLFDPEFRQAVEKGDVRKAATQVAKEYATGVIAAPIVGAGTGFAQRLAPRAAAAVIPAAATALRVANPVAVVSQLGGSSKMTPRQEAYENQLQETKFRKAEAARKRGGKWKFPTPFGNLTIPEFGISEAGGLFFR